MRGAANSFHGSSRVHRYNKRRRRAYEYISRNLRRLKKMSAIRPNTVVRTRLAIDCYHL